MKRALVLIGLLVALCSVLVGTADAAPTATERLQALEQDVLVRLNVSRAARGLRPLVMSDDLQSAAVAHSRTMLEDGFFAHDTPGGAPFVARLRGFYGSAGYESWSVGENLLYNTEEVTAETAIAAWLASPVHRENMLAPEWREVGIGSLHSRSAGGPFGGEQTWVITMDFGTRSGTTAKQTSATKPLNKPRSKTTGAGKPGAKPKSKGAGADQKATPATPAKNNAHPAKKKGKKAKSIDRLLPTPNRDPDDEGDDDAASGTSPTGHPDRDLEALGSGHRGDDEMDDVDETDGGGAVGPPLEP